MTSRQTVHDVLVVGAGMAGSTAARHLSDRGLDVVVVEKGRGAGGRMATRRGESGRYDHGAQYLTVGDEALAVQVDQWLEQRVVTPWSPVIRVLEEGEILPERRPVERYIGVGGMSALAKALLADIDCRYRTRVDGLDFDADGCRIRAGDQSFSARHVLLTAPAAQTADLLASAEPDLAEQARAVDMTPCWAVMAQFDGSPTIEFDAAFVNEGPLAWVCSQGARTHRSGGHRWLLHAADSWSQEHLEADANTVVDALLEAFAALPGVETARRLHCAAHRWRFARAEPGLDCDLLASNRLPITVAGDWCAGNRVEGAWISGRRAAERIADALGADH